MQRHVPLLDAYRPEGSQSREVLRQPDRRDDHRQLSDRGDAEYLERKLDARMNLDRASYQTQRQRQLEVADQKSILQIPVGERPVLTLAASEGMRASLARPPILPGGDGDRVHPIHHAFVVSGCPIGIGTGKPTRL